MTDELSSDIILNIMSRMPAKSLARFRCVSRLLCKYIDDDPYFAIIHGERAINEPIPITYQRGSYADRKVFRIHMIEPKGTVFEVRKKPCLEFNFLKWMILSYPASSFTLRGTCNGLLLMSAEYLNRTFLAVIHPLRKECYEVPPMNINNPRFDYKSRGLGFDTSTNTFKMVCVFLRTASNWEDSVDVIRKNLCTMVHVLGTHSWREIPAVPYYPIMGECVFAHGCLHWLVHCNHDQGRSDNHRGQIICFDVIGEEFGLINPPKKKGTEPIIFYYLIDLHGEFGYVYQTTHRIEVWVLKVNEWAMHCEFDHETQPPLHRQIPWVLGRWNKEGDIIMKSTKDQLFVYSLKSGLLEEVEIVGRHMALSRPITYMYPSSLLSIRGITPYKIIN